MIPVIGSPRSAQNDAKAAPQTVLASSSPFPASGKAPPKICRYLKSSAQTASWNVRVPANGRSTLTYTARVSWCSDHKLVTLSSAPQARVSKGA